MKFAQVLLFAALATSALTAAGANVGTGCFSSRKLFLYTNYILEPATHNAAAEFYKGSSDVMQGGGRKGVATDEQCYQEGYDYIKAHSRAAMIDSEVVDLAAHLNDWLLIKRANQFPTKFVLTHYPYLSTPFGAYADSSKNQPEKIGRGDIFTKTHAVKSGKINGENIAYSSNNRPCYWPVYAWIADCKVPGRGHRVNLYNATFLRNGSAASTEASGRQFYTQNYSRSAANVEIDPVYRTATEDERLLANFGTGAALDNSIGQGELVAKGWNFV